jgi:hypothetical protein
MKTNFSEDAHAAARVRLAAHQMEVATGICVECGQRAPCQAANEAAETLCTHGASLVEAGSHPPVIQRARRSRGDDWTWFRWIAGVR